MMRLVLAKRGVTSQQSKHVEWPRIDSGEKGGEKREKINQIQLITDHEVFYIDS